MNLNPNILVVEDNPGDDRLIREILNDFNVSHNFFLTTKWENGTTNTTRGGRVF